MKQPELGQRLTVLRQEKNLTQEELVEACNVSVRTIQRIESGEVTPRVSTVKILLTALGENIDSFDHPTKSTPQTTAKNWLQVAWIAGIVYLILGSVESILDYERFQLDALNLDLTSSHLPTFLTIIYISVKMISYASYFLFLMGIFQLARTFDNYLLKIGTILMIATSGLIVLTDIATLFIYTDEMLTIGLLISESILIGASGVIFGIGFIKLQDGMGRSALAAGVLEVIIGGCFLLVVLFFLGFILMIPAVIVEVILLYKGYELLRKDPSQE